MDFHAPRPKTAFETALEDMADLGRRFPAAPRGPDYGVNDGQLALEQMPEFLASLKAKRKAAE